MMMCSLVKQHFGDKQNSVNNIFHLSCNELKKKTNHHPLLTHLGNWPCMFFKHDQIRLLRVI